jgi:hypothetical protein
MNASAAKSGLVTEIVCAYVELVIAYISLY